MDISKILSFINEYGGIIIFLLVFLECLNIPGFPGGFMVIIAGITVRLKTLGFAEAFFISLTASILAMALVYYFSSIFSKFTIEFFNKTEKRKSVYDKTLKIVKKYGAGGLFVSRLVPLLRTFISIPAGLLSMNFMQYIIASSLGTSLYIIINIGVGYYLTNLFI